MRPPSATLLLVLTPLVGAAIGCEPRPDEGGDDEAAAPARTAAVSSDVLGALERTVHRADSAADAIEDRLRPVPLLRPAQEAGLRRYPNATHVARARELGARATDRSTVEELIADGRLIVLEDSTRHWVVRPRSTPAYVVPHTRALLVELGERFHDRLEEMGLPPYRFEVTSTLRTSGQQAALRRTNPNAAAGTSSHEFGTSVDVAWFSFPPPEELPEEIRVDAPDPLRPHLDRIGQLALESVSARKSPEMKAIFGQVLAEAQDEGLVFVILERLQPVFHITVAAPLADG